VRNADQIAVLHAGRVVELGTHEELLLLGGRYADLVRGGLGVEPVAA
jgi:ATP-binding cassette subfamily B protein